MAALLCISAERQGAPAPLVALHWKWSRYGWCIVKRYRWSLGDREVNVQSSIALRLPFSKRMLITCCTAEDYIWLSCKCDCTVCSRTTKFGTITRGEGACFRGQTHPFPSEQSPSISKISDLVYDTVWEREPNCVWWLN